MGTDTNASPKKTLLEQLDAFSMPYCTTKQAADLLGVTIRTVQMWVESGVLDAWRTGGGHRRILVASLRRYLEGKTRTASPTPTGLSVLVVEDDKVLQTLYQLRLLSCGTPLRVRVASNGYEALVNIGQEQPDVIITDLMMPEMDGFTLLRHLASMNQTAGIRISAVTALTEHDIAARGGLPQGVKVYHKPIPFDEIEADLSKLYNETAVTRH